MDCLPFSTQPFAPIGLEWKILEVVITRFLPLHDRDRLSVVLAIKIRYHSIDPHWLSCIQPFIEDVRQISPQHQNIPSFGSEKSTEVEQTLPMHKGCMIIRRHIGIEQSNAYAIALGSGSALDEITKVTNHSFVGIEAKGPSKTQLRTRNLEQEASVPRFGGESLNNITFPQGIFDDQRHLRMVTENIERIVSTCIVVRNNCIDMSANIIKRIAQNQRLVANPSDSN